MINDIIPWKQQKKVIEHFAQKIEEIQGRTIFDFTKRVSLMYKLLFDFC